MSSSNRTHQDPSLADPPASDSPDSPPAHNLNQDAGAADEDTCYVRAAEGGSASLGSGIRGRGAGMECVEERDDESRKSEAFSSFELVDKIRGQYDSFYDDEYKKVAL